MTHPVVGHDVLSQLIRQSTSSALSLLQLRKSAPTTRQAQLQASIPYSCSETRPCFAAAVVAVNEVISSELDGLLIWPPLVSMGKNRSYPSRQGNAPGRLACEISKKRLALAASRSSARQ